MGDGGEGTLDALVAALGGTRRSVDVTGPLGDPVRAPVGIVDRDGRRVAVVESAAASGLQLIGTPRRDPLRTTTFGTGELIAAATADGVDEVIVGVGGSATVDGGVGMAQALGVVFLDARGRPVGRGGAALLDVATVDVRTLDRAVARTRVVAAVDVDNPLVGPRGAAAVFGPQKGAGPDDVSLLEGALAHLAAVVERDLGIDVRDLPGAGAAGGLGAGLVAFLGARLHRGTRIVMEAVGFDPRLEQADVVVTGEGRLDASSLRGKVVGAVLERARIATTPTVIIAGSADVRPRDAVVETLVEAVGSERAVDDPRAALERVAADVAARVELRSSAR